MNKSAPTVPCPDGFDPKV